MRTNREKYDYYLGLIDKLGNKYVDSFFPNGRPKSVFEIVGRKVYEFEVIKICYCFGFDTLLDDSDVYYETHHITREDVNKIKELYLTASSLTPNYNNLSIRYTKPGGVNYVYQIDGVTRAFTLKELDEELSRIRKIYDNREGYTPCSYCDRQNEIDGGYKATVVFCKGMEIFSETRSYCNITCHWCDQVSLVKR